LRINKRRGENPKTKLAFEGFAKGATELGEEGEGFAPAHSHLQRSRSGGERLRVLRSGLLGFRRRSLGLDLGTWVSRGEREVRGERRRRGEKGEMKEEEAPGVKMPRSFG